MAKKIRSSGGRPAARIELTDEEREILNAMVRAGKTEKRAVERASIILAAASGMSTKEIAHEGKTREARVSKWRNRFSKFRLDGLIDRSGRGRKPVYDAEVERRIIRKLDEPPPEGYACWNGPLLARSLGDVSDDQVWKVLRKNNISLQRRRSWCISTDPEFAPKAANIVGLYLNPPENAIVLCVDEKPGIQALERAQGWLRLPNGKAITGFSHEYKRHGTTTLFGALEVATGLVKTGHYNRRRRREFLDFMNEVIKDYPDTEIHVILDNLKTHKPKNDMWLRRHKNVHFHFTPTHASWLNQIECWFSLLTRYALKNTSFTSPAQVREAIDAFVAVHNDNAAPFEWKKKTVVSVAPKYYYSNLCK